MRKLIVPKRIEKLTAFIVNFERVYYWLNALAFPFAAFAINERFEIGWGLSLLAALCLLILVPLDRWGCGFGFLNLIAGFFGIALLGNRLFG